MLQENNDHLSVAWDTGQVSKYHWLWLRDSCQCSECRNSHAKQKYFDPASLVIDIKPKMVAKNDDLISITWEDGHASQFKCSWMLENDYSHLSDSSAESQKLKWLSWNDKIAIEDAKYSFSDISENNSILINAIHHLCQYGMIVIKAEENANASFDFLCEKIAGFVHRSYFGDYFDLVTKPDNNTDSISFSTKFLPLHTDIPYYFNPPDFQFLYGLNVIPNSDGYTGGNTRFVDGLFAAETLRGSDPEAFKILTEIQVVYRADYPDANKIYQNSTQILKVDDKGNIIQILNNPSKMFFENIPFESMLPLYEAYKKFKELLEKTEHSYLHSWKQGDMIIFDNRRLFHGRQEFSDPDVVRTLRGGYFSEVELLARLKFLTSQNK